MSGETDNKSVSIQVKAQPMGGGGVMPSVPQGTIRGSRKRTIPRRSHGHAADHPFMNRRAIAIHVQRDI